MTGRRNVTSQEMLLICGEHGWSGTQAGECPFCRIAKLEAHVDYCRQWHTADTEQQKLLRSDSPPASAERTDNPRSATSAVKRYAMIRGVECGSTNELNGAFVFLEADYAALAAKLEVSEAASRAAVSKAEWQSRTNHEMNQSQARIRELEASLRQARPYVYNAEVADAADLEARHAVLSVIDALVPGRRN